jgi:hypothetical protein
MKVTYKKKPSYLEGVMFNDVTDLNDVLEFVKGTYDDVKVGLMKNENGEQVIYVQVSDEILMTAGGRAVLTHDKSGNIVMIPEANILKGYDLVDLTLVDGPKTDEQ